MKIKKDNPVIILDAFETALGVARSLGKEGIKSYCFDFKKDICFYSRYAKGVLVPHPLEEEKKFIEFLIDFSKRFDYKPVLFITSDHFLKCISKNFELLSGYCLVNISDNEIIENITNKFLLYLKCKDTGIDVPKTIYINSNTDLSELDEPDYPVLIKGLDVNKWRKLIDGSRKGFVVKTKDELIKISDEIRSKNVDVVVQEIIKGPDKNHYKTCVYYDLQGNQLLNFTLRKLIQNPVHFGVGAIVESIDYPELRDSGTKLFDSLNYRGVGSAEFKLDERDGKLKLIEINPRYWQQNYLSTVCGMNFPLIDYMELTGQNPVQTDNFKPGVKWVNRYMAFDSYLAYRKEGNISYKEWLKLKRGKKVYSDFIFNDPVPMLFELGFGKKLFNIPKYFIKRIFKN